MLSKNYKDRLILIQILNNYQMNKNKKESNILKNQKKILKMKFKIMQLRNKNTNSNQKNWLIKRNLGKKKSDSKN